MADFLPDLTGSFSTSAAQNPTVDLMEAAYSDAGLHCRYINCEVPPEKLADAVKGARAMGWRGFNLSIPHKVAVIQHLDGLGESAAIMGAVNCAVNRNGKLIGENTDGLGFVQALREVIARAEALGGPTRWELRVDGTPMELAPEQVETLHRAAQSLVANLQRHAEAQRCLLTGGAPPLSPPTPWRCARLSIISARSQRCLRRHAQRWTHWHRVHPSASTRRSGRCGTGLTRPTSWLAPPNWSARCH